MYNKAVSNVNKLRKIEASPYFTERLNEAQLEVERREATEKGIKEGAEREREKWLGVVAVKDVEILNQAAEIAELRRRLGENK